MTKPEEKVPMTGREKSLLATAKALKKTADMARERVLAAGWFGRMPYSVYADAEKAYQEADTEFWDVVRLRGSEWKNAYSLNYQGHKVWYTK